MLAVHLTFGEESALSHMLITSPMGGGTFPFLVADQHRSSVLLFLITACQGLWMRSRVVSRGQRGLPVGRSWQHHATPL